MWNTEINKCIIFTYVYSSKSQNTDEFWSKHSIIKRPCLMLTNVNLFSRPHLSLGIQGLAFSVHIQSYWVSNLCKFFLKEFDKQGWVDKLLSSNETMAGLETLINMCWRKEGRNEGRKEGRGDHNLFIYHWGYKRPETWDLDLLPGIGPYRPFESGCEEGSRETLSLHQEGLPLGTQKAHERGNQIHYVWCLRVTYWLCGLSELWFHFL